jgi:hypothetical protein
MQIVRLVVKPGAAERASPGARRSTPSRASFGICVSVPEISCRSKFLVSGRVFSSPRIHHFITLLIFGGAIRGRALSSSAVWSVLLFKRAKSPAKNSPACDGYNFINIREKKIIIELFPSFPLIKFRGPIL